VPVVLQRCWLSHPAKAQGSEFSGSTAWESAVRARLYLSDRPPDVPIDDEEQPIEDRARYLARRKANYSALDLRKFSLIDGSLIPEEVQPASFGRPSGEAAKDVVRRAVRKLGELGMNGSAGTRSGDYLPKLAKQYGLLEGLSERAFADAMRKLVMDRQLTNAEVGKYANRTPKMGLVLK
jgi:hypothetical protein